MGIKHSKAAIREKVSTVVQIFSINRVQLFRERISTVQRPRSEKAGQDKMISIVMISDGGDDQCNTVQCSDLDQRKQPR